MTLERADIQGLFARGYSNLALATFLLLGLEDDASGRRWLGDALSGVTFAPSGKAAAPSTFDLLLQPFRHT